MAGDTGSAHWLRVGFAVLVAGALIGCEGAPPWDADRGTAAGDADAPGTPLPLPDPVTPDNPSATPRIALANFLAAENIAEVPPHRNARVDLDNDGREDLLMLLEGRNWCDDGGCTLLVFHREGDESYRLVTRTRATHAPIRVSRRLHNGWHDLLVGVGGAGIRPGTVALQFNGASYPADPTLLAMLAEHALPPARVVIE